MNRCTGWIAFCAVLVVAVVAFVLWKALRHPAQEAEPAPTAVVTVAQVQLQDVPEVTGAFGAVQGDPTKARTVAAPRAVIVERVLVRPGQPVSAGTPLMVFANAPATAMAYRQAVSAQDAAVSDLARVKRMLNEHLATTDQIIAAEKAVRDARAALAAQTATGAQHGAQSFSAPFAGVVATVPVSPGDHVAQDAPLLTLSSASGMVAQLGVEPSAALRVRVGQLVILTPVFEPQMKLQSQVTSVAAQIDGTSRLINVSAPAPGGVAPVGSAVSAEIVLSSHQGLVVPRAAVVFDEKGAHVFVVRGGKATQVLVKVVGDHPDFSEVQGELSAKDVVVVQGAYELQDEMAVRVARR